MPELPEVETTRVGIAPHIEGQIIERVIVRDYRLRWPIPADIEKILTGQQILQVQRRAKYLLFKTPTGTLIMHLGMSGRMRVVDTPVKPAKHDHVDITFRNGLTLRFTDPRRFGAMLWTTTSTDLHPLIHHLGPEPLSEDFTGDSLYQRSRKRQVSIKTFIMNAEIVVGVGNIYASEACFLARLHPEMKAGKLTRPQAERLATAIKTVLEKAIAAGGTTLRDFRDAAGNPGYFAQKLFVYARANQPCRHCDQIIVQCRQANRATFFCPGCQKG
ncbi:Formamidopyrimidine-DNA glycosylase [Methylophaga frappieri]|uniref:Formamidopyrimidine-DNA glycosylase n=1 Tax=Methylophaga frappieri (strain ATCC BAA-2434 / DSM 25690 / JAM7) TaxID=754477 RepID=I1YHF2_METFJ|nr:bifunctional DNA-formamidopyrimidine glycosylase/DNA-(apurinic or apyrimidinic site) lyase [Methylophaga frappieri]AFJ02345.1 Formamidopyrimidine-DNA glycosylase [Methylophaga frappieri]